MEYKVVEVKWSRSGNFVGTPPIVERQPELTKQLRKFTDDGWTVLDIHHEVGDNLRFSIVTFQKPTRSTIEPQGMVNPQNVQNLSQEQETNQVTSVQTTFPLTGGLYLSREEDSTSSLRFDDRGRVQVFDLGDNPEATEGWNAVITATAIVDFGVWDDDYDFGEYRIDGSNIEFSQGSKSGIEFRGNIVSPTELDLEFDSAISGKKTKGRYKFVEVESLR